MRTTLDIDDRVLAVAKARAGANRTSAGFEISALALQALNNDSRTGAGYSPSGRFKLLPASPPGHVITAKMVEDALNDIE